MAVMLPPFPARRSFVHGSLYNLSNGHLSSNTPQFTQELHGVVSCKKLTFSELLFVSHTSHGNLKVHCNVRRSPVVILS